MTISIPKTTQESEKGVNLVQDDDTPSFFNGVSGYPQGVSLFRPCFDALVDDLGVLLYIVALIMT
jgi:hypothetical protein